MINYLLNTVWQARKNLESWRLSPSGQTLRSQPGYCRHPGSRSPGELTAFAGNPPNHQKRSSRLSVFRTTVPDHHTSAVSSQWLENRNSWPPWGQRCLLVNKLMSCCCVRLRLVLEIVWKRVVNNRGSQQNVDCQKPGSPRMRTRHSRIQPSSRPAVQLWRIIHLR